MVFVHNINPTFLSLGFFEIRWYGLFFVLGFFVVYFFLKKQVKDGFLKIQEKDLDSLLFFSILGMIVGARLFAVFVYNPGYYFSNPLEIFAFWKGGLSFHGGLLGILFAVFLWCKKNSFSFLRICDFVVIPASLAQVFGRIGNFINGELYGKITSLPWAVKFQNVDGFRHPTQLYEAFYNLIIFFVLFFYFKKYYLKNPASGRIFALFLILYSVFRILFEFVKDMPLYGPLTMGQWLSIPLLFFGLFLFFKK
jgi:phosphatidylglycerol---prolipoprotein diacylglyceryl transferase